MESDKSACKHELVIIEGQKDWWCWLCKKYEHELKENSIKTEIKTESSEAECAGS